MRVEGFIQGQTLNSTTLSEILSRLNPGDMVRAQVLEIMSSEVLLKLFDGSQIKAATMADLDADKGEFANFLVKSKSDNQIFLEQVKNTSIKNESLQSNLAKQLESTGIKINAQNLEIAEKLSQNFIAIKKDLFDNAIDIISKFKDLGTSKSVFLASNNITPDAKNIEALKYLVDAKMQIGNEVEKIINALSLAEANNTNSLKLVNSKPEYASINITDTDITQFLNDELQSENKSILLNLVKGFELGPKIKDFLINSLKLTSDQTNAMINQFIRDIKAYLRPKERIALTEFLTALSDKFTKLESNNMNDYIKKTGLEDIKNGLKEIFVKIDIEKLDENGNIKELYKELYEKLESLKGNSGLSALTSKDELMQRTENLQNQIRFINDINQHNSYMQIPINIFNKNSTGEIFILKRGSRKKKINPDDVTMLVALDTQFIGRFETLININKKNIALNMRVEDEKIISILKENYKDLYDRINSKGYKLVDVKYRLMDEPINVINANEVVTRELNHNKVSVDIKL